MDRAIQKALAAIRAQAAKDRLRPKGEEKPILAITISGVEDGGVVAPVDELDDEVVAPVDELDEGDVVAPVDEEDEDEEE